MNRFAIAVAGALMGVVGFTHSASATFVGSALTISGETFTVTGCSAGSTFCNGLQMVQDGSNIGITIDAINSSALVTGTGQIATSDLTLNLTVSGSSVIQAVGASVTGSDGGKPAFASLAGVGETIANGANTFTGNGVLDGGISWISTTPGFTSLDLTKDIHVLSVALPVGTTMSIASVTQDLRYGVPEPASIAVMLAGLAAAAGIRLRRRRS